MNWNLYRTFENQNLGKRYSVFYHVSYANRLFQIMLGFTESGICQLLEHHWIDEEQSCFSKRLTLLPYMREHLAQGKGLREFATETEARTFVEARIIEWVALTSN